MLKEYGLDPALLGDWDKFRFYFDSFGVPKGRWILGLPSCNGWRKQVYKSLSSSITEMQKKRIVEKLKSEFKAKVVSFNGSGKWDNSKDWLVNTEEEFEYSPFQAIITSDNPRNVDYVICDAELDDEHELWKNNCQLNVARNAQDMSEKAKLLLQKAQIIIFVDPYFSPRATVDIPVRFTKTLEAFLDLAVLRNSDVELVTVEYYLKKMYGCSTFQAKCQGELPCIINNSIKVTFKQILEKAGGERIHPRYILTDIGGIGVEGGLDEGSEGQTTEMRLLEKDVYENIWNHYQPNSFAFDLKQEVIVQGIKHANVS